MVLPAIAARLVGAGVARFGGAAAGRTVATRLATKVVPTMVARIPSRAAAAAALARVGVRAKASVVTTLGKLPLPAAIRRTLPVAARPATTLKAAVTKAGIGLIEKPFRTVLPYAATVGMMGAASRIGEEKAGAAAKRGGLVGEALTFPSRAAVGLPAGLGGDGMARTVGEVPIMEPVIVRSWTTGTTDFAVDSTGKHWVLTRSGWKKYSPKKPIVLGTKHLTPKKFIAAAKKYYGLKKDLDKVFKVVRKKK